MRPHALPLVDAQAPADVQPIAFEGMLGWLHRPATPTGEVGVVVCAPVGRDARCTHLLLRWIAEALAERGYPVLRFDYHSCGDSLDLDPQADALAAWVEDVHHAAEALRAAAGVRRLAFCGLRLGASLAAQAAQTREDVAALALLAPVTRGRTWLRELKMAAAFSTPAHRPGPSLAAPPPAAALDSDGLQLSAASVDSLRTLDLERLERAPAEVLLVARSPGAGPLGAHLSGLGARVTEERFPGFERLFDESHSNVLPEALVQSVADWLGARAPPRLGEPPPASRIPAPAELRPPGAIERPVSFGEGLRGVLCLPADGAADARVAVFCNTGGDPRVGAGRFQAHAARRLAQVGLASLRFDFAGLGDSPMPQGQAARSHVYETPRERDLDATLEYLSSQGLDQPVLVGLCAGAYHAFWTAAADPRVRGVFLISLIKFVWRPGDSLDIGRRDEARAARSYVQSLGDPGVWGRMARGEVRLWSIAASLLRRFSARLKTSTRRRERRLVRHAAQTLSGRGVKGRLLLGLDDGSLDELETYFGRDGGDWAAKPNLSVSIVEGLDHGLLRPASRAVAIEELRAFMLA